MLAVFFKYRWFLSFSAVPVLMLRRRRFDGGYGKWNLHIKEETSQ